MRFRVKPLAGLSVILSLITFSLGAQSLPALPQASEAVTGVLPNGISFYLVSNPQQKGFADFALVQKDAVGEDVLRAPLTELPHFQSGRPYQYLAKLGSGYGKSGYIRSSGRSSAYVFSDIPVSQETIRDTTLLLLFDIAASCPTEQAVIVCGDIDKSAVRQRMNVFSMMVTPRTKAPAPEPYAWRPDSLSVSVSGSPDPALATVSVRYSSPRIPASAMNTVQAGVTELYARQLGSVVRDRTEEAFYREGMAFAGLTVEFLGSADGPGDELYTIEATIAPGDELRAVSLIAGVLGGLDTAGAALPEFILARDRILSEMASASLTNADWVSLCESAYLYGSALVTPSAVSGYFSSRDVPARKELELFNSFVSALLSPDVAAEIICTTPSASLSGEEIKAAFSSSWKDVSDNNSESWPRFAPDTLALQVPKAKAKLKKTASEPVTGGELWTFSNGMRVIYKRQKEYKGRFSYGFLLNGGYAGISGLEAGEGAFIGDLLLQEDVAGMDAWHFRKMLGSFGISMEVEAGLSSMRITGSAPSSSFQLLMKSLLGLANDRNTNISSYDHYRSSERLRISIDRRSGEGIDAVLDSILCPVFPATPHKSAKALSDDLPEKAERFFEERFSRCDDGVLVLVGDLDPYMLKKVLPKYIGAFHTGGQASPRPLLRSEIRSGWSTYTVEAEECDAGDGSPSIDVAISAPMPFSLGKYMSFKVAAMELKKSLAAGLAEAGMYAEVRDELMLYPEERMTFRLSCRQCEAAGLPAGIAPENPLFAIGALRKALAGLSSTEVPAGSVNASKSALAAGLEASLKSNEGLVKAAMMRYSSGKDPVSGYKDRINAVSPATVKDVFATLEGGGRVEFILY